MGDRVRSWTGNGFFWSGNVSMVVGSALTTGGAVILQRYFDEADALRLIEAEKISFANGKAPPVGEASRLNRIGPKPIYPVSNTHLAASSYSNIRRSIPTTACRCPSEPRRP